MSPFLFINDIPFGLGWTGGLSQPTSGVCTKPQTKGCPRVESIGGYNLSLIKITKCTSWFFSEHALYVNESYYVTCTVVSYHTSKAIAHFKISPIIEKRWPIMHRKKSNPCADLWPHVRLSPYDSTARSGPALRRQTLYALTQWVIVATRPTKLQVCYCRPWRLLKQFLKYQETTNLYT